MDIKLFIKGNNQQQVYNFRLAKDKVKAYFQKTFDNLYKDNGIVFVKYLRKHIFKIACLIEGYLVIITGND